MYCDDKSQDQGDSSSKNLDSALQELGMLTTNTNNYYFHEMRRKSFGSKPNTYARKPIPMNLDKGIKLQQNSKYVSKIYTLGFRQKRRLKRATNNRTNPYLILDRTRTRSENSDGANIDCKQSLGDSQDIWMEHSSSYVSVLDPKIGRCLTSSISQPCLIKSRSLENIRVENIEASQPSHEMEFVSSRIQKLKVME